MEQEFKKDRREFFKSSASLAVAATFGSLLDVLKDKPRLSFSTLGCPGWSFKKVIQSAVENDYQGIELRGILV
ncbi:hypothetical protein [Dyadobacter arcticus]|uniref:Uncharacterized protein n=1 Tax=Dyadobacter arcticus TaxID=1078754 RepID=A0ABX0UP57_9BACT|nr:hypothetical protein [Dyadobacter arcticus]NIJ54642.1 hypothetical protein [Dyadobacter arcticus]